jgi:hypothetical protein
MTYATARRLPVAVVALAVASTASEPTEPDALELIRLALRETTEAHGRALSVRAMLVGEAPADGASRVSVTG